MLEESPLRHDRLHARGLRRLRRRRLRPRPRHGRAVRHLLRRRPQRVQLDRRRVRREVARRDDHRLARPARADPQSAAAPHGSQLPHAVRRVRKAVRRRHRARRPAHRVQRNRPRAGHVRTVTSGPCTSKSPATWSTCGPRPRRPTSSPKLRSDTRALAEAVDETVKRIENARQPVLLLGVEIHRFGLQEDAVQAGRGIRHPDGRHDARQRRRRRNASALHGPLRRRARPRRGHQVRRGQRLRHHARHVHDRHQPRHLHGRARPGRLHLRHERSSCRVRYHHYHDVRLADFVRTLDQRGIRGPRTRRRPRRPTIARSRSRCGRTTRSPSRG